MTWCIEEGQHLTVLIHLISTDVLSDPTRFARYNFGIPDRIKKRGFTVVYVTHHSNDGRTWLLVFFVFFNRRDDVFHISIRYTHNFVAEFFDDEFGCISINRFVLRYHQAVLHQRFHNGADTFSHTVRQFRNDNRFR